ncbi:DUF2779 domain-containing protein [Mycoplasma tauri]|uniref:DUF2779 domain-containing protein n=1 Tax=Mycoplasma tauri TaxID=547987 RepID=UPI001CBAE6FB|nr:DUF2779 domain-containing protein [Mycoplasma tauri]MBZ4204201.1 DUF2779 domain-containing protein [Mycoplasma tauri]
MKISEMKLKMNRDKKITERQYIKSFYNQGYFLWNSELDFESKYITPLKSKDTLNCLNIYDDDILDEDDTELEDEVGQTIWNNLLNIYFDTSIQTVDGNMNIFDKVKKQLNNWAFDTLFKNKSIKIISSKGTTESKFFETNKELENNNVEVLINPFFTYKTGEFDVVSNVFAYDKTNSTIYLFKLKTSTTNQNLFSTKYAYEVAKKSLNLPINDIKVIIIDTSYPLEKGNVKFICTNLCYMGKNKKSIDRKTWMEKGSSLPKNINPLFKNRHNFSLYFSQGWLWNKSDLQITLNNEPVSQNFNYLKCIKNNCGLLNPKWQYKDGVSRFSLPKNSNIFDDKLYLGSFEDQIEYIKKSYFINKPDFSEFTEAKFDGDHKDYRESIGLNSILYKNYVNALLGQDLMFSKLVFMDLKSNAILKNGFINSLNKHRKKVEIAKKIDDFINSYAIEKYLSSLHIKNEKIVWYDYESFMSIIPVFDDFIPYSQVVNQVSIIETINGKIVNNTQEDIVIDPLKIEIFDLIFLLKNLYDRQGNKYVVYNKGFENSRNLEIAEWVMQHQNDDKFVHELKKRFDITPYDVKKFQEYINNNTIDLMELFKTYRDKNENEYYQNILISLQNSWKDKILDTASFSSKNFIVEMQQSNKDSSNVLFTINDQPDQTISKIHETDEDEKKGLESILNFNIYLKGLKGFNSIKKIEKFITAEKLKLDHMITPYPQLEGVHNGSEAMALAIKRYCGLIGDNMWNKNLDNLKQYCHNDVLAMIMSFNFVEFLSENIFPEIKTLKYTFNEKYRYEIDKYSWKIDIKEKSK